MSNNIRTIGYQAFFDCRRLSSIELPNTISRIESHSFAHCKSLKRFRIPTTVTSIGGHAFANCDSLSSIVIPPYVRTIEESTFYECFSLESVQIPEGITSVGYNAFWACQKLTSITLPNTVTAIGNLAFGGCVRLDTIVIKAITPPSLGGVSVFRDIHDTAKVFVPCRSVNAYPITWGIRSHLTNFIGITDTIRIARQICLGNLYSDENFENLQGGTYYHTIRTANDCDSIICLTVTELDAQLQNITVSPSPNNTALEIIWEGRANSYKVYRNDRLVTSTTNRFYVDHYSNLTNGEEYCYHVVARMSNCDNQYSDTVCYTVNIIDVPQQTVASNSPKVYPNPANDRFFVEYKGNFSVKLYDLLGREVAYQNATERAELSVSGLQAGVYSLVVVAGSEVVGRELVVVE
jgi:hypothetical protein